MKVVCINGCEHTFIVLLATIFKCLLPFTEGQVKDILAERFGPIEEIKQFIVCDETGASGAPNPHSHAVLVMKEAINFTDFKKWWDLYELPNYGDIESCKNLKQAMAFCKGDKEINTFSVMLWCSNLFSDNLFSIRSVVCPQIPNVAAITEPPSHSKMGKHLMKDCPVCKKEVRSNNMQRP
jgi:hypothetical protein